MGGRRGVRVLNSSRSRSSSSSSTANQRGGAAHVQEARRTTWTWHTKRFAWLGALLPKYILD